MLRKSIILTLVLVIAMCPLGCTNQEEKAENKKTVAVEVAQASKGDLVVRVPVPGTIAAETQVNLSFKAAGKVTEVCVKAGGKVKKGQVLARLEQGDVLSQVSQAEAMAEAARANLKRAEKGARPEEIDQMRAHVEAAKAASDTAQSNLERMKKLHDAGAIPKAQLEGAELQAVSAKQQMIAAEKQLQLALQGTPEETLAGARAQAKQAEAAANLARSQLAGAAIQAPFDGEVFSVTVKEGELISPGMPAVILVNTSNLCVQASLPENLAKYASIGKEVFVRLKTTPGESSWVSTSQSPDVLKEAGYMPAVLVEVSPCADPRTRGFPIKAVLSEETEEALRPGMFAEILLPTETASDVVMVPRRSVLTVETDRIEEVRYIAFVVKDSSSGEESGSEQNDVRVVEERVLQVGMATPDSLEIRNGIKEGDLVVVTGQHFLENASPVVVAEWARVGGKE